MKPIKKTSIIFTVFCLFFFFHNYLHSQTVTVKMLTGKELHGVLISLTTDEIALDPDGSVSYLSLYTKDLESVTFPDGMVLKTPITKEMIPSRFQESAKKKKTDHDSHYYTSYTEIYFFGGISSKKTIGSYEVTDEFGQSSGVIDMIYKNGGFGGLGVSFMGIGKNRRPDIMLDLEAAYYHASMIGKFQSQQEELLTGEVLSVDMNFYLFPFKARNNYPSPFVFAGFGCRLVGMTPVDGSSEEVIEGHGELPFGLGIRQKISRGVAFQIKERLVYSKLKGVSGFILPETRLELYITVGKN
ncbi:MAG: hypothetical protein WCK34_15150 [Bacteroidota bacterium]